MADYKHIIPFIKKAEGGWVNNPNDPGGETNVGITYKVWQTMFGPTHNRFMTMADADWDAIFKEYYWNEMCGDTIASQRIADIVVDWVWNSGKHNPEMYVQDILIHSFGQNIAEDGDFGPASVAAINAVDEEKLWNDIVAKRLWYYDQLVTLRPSNAQFLQGWKNRVNNLVAFENTAKLV